MRFRTASPSRRPFSCFPLSHWCISVCYSPLTSIAMHRSSLVLFVATMFLTKRGAMFPAWLRSLVKLVNNGQSGRRSRRKSGGSIAALLQPAVVSNSRIGWCRRRSSCRQAWSPRGEALCRLPSTSIRLMMPVNGNLAYPRPTQIFFTIQPYLPCPPAASLWARLPPTVRRPTGRAIRRQPEWLGPEAEQIFVAGEIQLGLSTPVESSPTAAAAAWC